jgi:hypothetical protein
VSATQTRATPPLPAVLEVGSAGREDRLVPAAGVLITLGQRSHVGLAHRFGARWSFERVAVSPLLGLTLETLAPTPIVRPATTSLGAHLALSRRLAVCAQVDYLSAAALHSGMRQGYREVPFARQAWEPRAAIEWAWPLGRLALQWRAGVQWRSDATLVERLQPAESLPAGTWAWSPPPSPELFERIPEAGVATLVDAKWRFSGGVSVVTRAGLRLDVAARGGQAPTALLIGAGWRF